MIRLFFAGMIGLTAIPIFGEERIDFVHQIKPLLNRHCVDCHGAEEQNGGLRLDRSAAAFAEADSGHAAIVPGMPEGSGLLARVRSRSEDDRMPPDGDRLSEAEIDLLRRWIASGAEWPAADESSEHSFPETDHWAFQPIRAVAPPAVRELAWPTGDLDRFVQARREAAGLAVVGDATPVDLIRRATYGLTGLPPTIQEVDAFRGRVAEVGRAEAMVELVDDLLSRPTYGQRWGRHWMDWVRYADTAGDNSDFPIPQAFLYRNYIIDSFNNDLPYDQFLIEQIAGDLLPASTLEERNRQLIATGYLAMARRFGSLIERYPWHLTIEDTIDNVGRTMMGMTLACARCHDHKFDPISARDYYAMYGIFASTRYPFPGIELFQTQRDFVSLMDSAETRARLKEFQPESDRLAAELQKHLDRCEARARENALREKDCSLEQRRKMREELDGMLIQARKAGEKLAAHLRTLPEIPSAYAVADADAIDARIQIKGEPTRPGAQVRRGFPEILGGWKLDPDVADSTSGRKQLAEWITHPQNPLTARVIVNRVWQRHFGTGIVSSTSDFGLRGESPTHPDLLDWLATDFMNNGWSLKHLQRRILTSHTYALSSAGHSDNLARDPNNSLHWRFNRQRLDAESIRDSVMMIAGTLDVSPQTDPYPFPPREKWKFTQHHPFNDDYPSNKRSVYLMTKRLTAGTYYQTFDGPDPNACTSNRDQSITALQALYFVNDQFLHDQASRFAEAVIHHSGDPQKRIDFAVRTLLCRPPTNEETRQLLAHLDKVAARIGDGSDVERQKWASLTRSLLRLNEFLYLD
ncbi:Planctomycete cytochrome C [Stieleria maiorica]|uniref:Planctomycete cytochrome C n=1 Tax=Stieleria maiorica TaxID=2795974 RepID=A0A5B9MPE8_9BACT|nr:PSD1 and planctomycete cytochrome C domain-containing protein [Stieleria maiorica]QEG01981.1 Planctomycete cytochrome C [Stieleria maiorica]